MQARTEAGHAGRRVIDSDRNRREGTETLGDAMSFDFAEIFTVGVRHVVPLARSRGLSFAFDCQTEGLMLKGDPAAAQGGLHRLFLELLALIQAGSLVISAKAVQSDANRSLCVRAAGVGKVPAQEAINASWERLQLVACPSTSQEPGASTARGLCPHTGGAIEMSAIPGQGVMITLELTSLDHTSWEPHADSDAHGARAWLVNVDDALATSWNRRLQRLGWAVSRFASYEAAMAQLANAPQTARPALVIVLETGNPKTDGTLSLPPLLPGWSRLVYAVQTGAVTLRNPKTVSGYEVHVYPLSPSDLEAMTSEASDVELGSGTTTPMPLSTPDMPTVLIVDDTPLNLVVGQGFAEALGYRVKTAIDGYDAIDKCRREAPHVVFMDLHMPRLDGIDTVRRLRALQSEGHIPPFPITVLTAGWSPEVKAKCLAAGADECLAKPISLEAMAAELSRVSSYR